MGFLGGGSRGQREVRILEGSNPPMYYATYQNRPKGLLSEEEKKNLGVAIGALTLAFAAILWRIYDQDIAEIPTLLGDFLVIMIISLVVVSTGFALHELAHKFVAQKYGCWAEFRYSTQGLLIALLLAFVAGFLFAAPGAVYIIGQIDKRQNGIISIAGPLTNVAVTLVMIPFYLWGSFWIYTTAYWVIFFNTLLALFNMIPIMPLDGAKVLKWNIGIYIVAVIGMGALLYYTRFVMPDL